MKPCVVSGSHVSVIGPASCSAAIRPDDVHSARLVNFSGGKGRSTNSAGMTVIEYLCSKNRLGPGLTTIGGPDREDRGFKAIVYRHDDRTIGLHDGLSADDAGMVGSRLGHSPRLAPIGGGAHLHPVDVASVVELGIAVTEEGAAGRIVADGPVFVVKLTGSIHHNGSAP